MLVEEVVVWPKLKPNVKAKWLEALRSGKYPQGEAALRTRMPNGTDSFCCLGVLCDVLSPNEWSPEPAGSKRNLITFQPSPVFMGWSAFLPNRLMQEQFIGAENSGLPHKLQLHLGSMNDKDHKSFAEIAQWIEENL